MSNQILCACGKYHKRDQPLVITITACPKKKHPSHITSLPSSPKKSLSHEGSQHEEPVSPKDAVRKKGSQAYQSPKQSNIKKPVDQPPVIPKQSSLKKPSVAEKKQASKMDAPGNLNRSISIANGRKEPYDHVLECEEDGVAVPPKLAETPLIDNSTFCDLDESKKSKAEKGTDKFEPEKRSKGESGTQMSGAQGTFFDPSHESNRNEESFIKSVPGQDSDMNQSIPSSRRNRDAEIGKADQRSPSSLELKLPILVPRYHGPGCAMEIDVMEKHDQNCRYRKKKNPERNPVDDRSGSYEVIGRLRFKTCHPEPPFIGQEINKIADDTSQNAKVATIYSLFNIPHKTKSKKVCLTTSESKRRLEKYLRHKKILEDLTKSVKSFPSQSRRCVEDTRRIIQFEQEPKRVRSVSRENITSCEVEVLYFCENTGCQSVQFAKGPRTKLISLKRWLYHILPCVSKEESHPLLLEDAGRSSG